MMPLSISERFWAKVDKSGDCWEWTAGRKSDGYGMFFISPVNKMAHRVSYEMENGPIPGGMEIDHTCHNRGCVKPEHLRVVTRKKNAENRAGAQSNSKSGVRGVCWFKPAARWHARVWHNGKAISVGYFHDLDEASAAVTAKREEIYNQKKAA